MKNTSFKRLITIFLIVFITAASALAGDAAETYYVNNSSSTLAGGLASSYAIGGSGSVMKLDSSTAYAMTGSGLVKLEGTSEITAPQKLTVSGTVPIKTTTVKVGLYYYYSANRDTTLETASLQNYIGSGYKFGYYDSSRVFNEIGYTNETVLTMLKDTNVQVTSGTVGCYHILLPDQYSTFADAKNAASAYSDGFPAYYNGVYRALVGNYTSAADATAAMSSRGISGSAYSASNRCIVVTKSGTTQILFEFDYGSTYSLAIRPQSNSGKAQTWFKGYKYYGDFEYMRITGEKLTVVNVLDIEDYVKGVIPYEMSGSWPLEALKAQALCARTYVAQNINSYSKYGFDVTSDTYSQAYKGINSANATTDAAVDGTKGMYITYNGALTSTLYYSSNGGASENSENVFSSKVAYLVGVIDPYEEGAASINSYNSWKRTMSAATITSKLSAYNVATIIDIQPTFSGTGNVISLKFTDANGKTVNISKDSCRTVLGLPNIRYSITKSGNDYVFEGGGWGHNVGMSQFGAYAMASKYGYTFDQIISFYYTGVSLSTGVVR